MSDDQNELSEEQKKRNTEAMHLCAIVLGYNELVKQADTIGDKAYFRLFREEYYKKLQTYSDTPWALKFAEEAPKTE